MQLHPDVGINRRSLESLNRITSVGFFSLIYCISYLQNMQNIHYSHGRARW